KVELKPHLLQCGFCYSVTPSVVGVASFAAAGGVASFALAGVSFIPEGVTGFTGPSEFSLCAILHKPSRLASLASPLYSTVSMLGHTDFKASTTKDATEREPSMLLEREPPPLSRNAFTL